MPIRQELRGGLVPVRLYTDDVDAKSLEQLANVARLPIVHHHVAAMPDVHLGIGATVGSVVPTLKAIIPAAVGVDIGCGMMATRLSLSGRDLDEKALKRIFSQIEKEIPAGFNQHDKALAHAAKPFEKGLRRILEKHPGVQKRVGKRSDWTRKPSRN